MTLFIQYTKRLQIVFLNASAWLPRNTYYLTIKLVLFLMTLLLYCRIRTHTLVYLCIWKWISCIYSTQVAFIL
jgi:hypothetical protein